MNELKYIFTFWSKSVVQKSNVLFVSRLNCGALALAAPVWGMIVKRRRLQVFMLAPGRTGNAREVLCCVFRRLRAGYTKGGSRGGGGGYFLLWTKRRETCPQEGLWPTFSLRPGLSFFFLYFINFFLILKRVLRVLSVWWKKKLNGIVRAQMEWQYLVRNWGEDIK